MFDSEYGGYSGDDVEPDDELIIEQAYKEPGVRGSVYVFHCKRTDRIIAGITLNGTVITRLGMIDNLTDNEWFELLQKLSRHER
jgi:hypothetical protein